MDNSSSFQSARWQGRLRQLRTFGRSALPFVSGIFATLVGLLIYSALVPTPAPLTMDEVNESVAQAMASATPAPAYSSLVYQAVLPSLVFIEVVRPGDVLNDMVPEVDEENLPQENDPPESNPPENVPPPSTPQAPNDSNEAEGSPRASGLGSGVVINTDGEVLTSLHVVTQAVGITLTFADGTESAARIVAVQPENDIAVLRPAVLPKVLVPAVLGNPHAMRVGDEAFAVGHPFGLYASMTSGVISGFERTFRLQDSEQRLEGLIQIDAAVNPGNSGGPLLNRYGQVVGIVTGLANPTQETFFVGIGFAVPIDIAGGAAGLPPY